MSPAKELIGMTQVLRALVYLFQQTTGIRPWPRRITVRMRRTAISHPY